MADEKICPHCGRPVSPTALGGICPECMLKAGLATQTEGPHGTKVLQPPPAPAEIASLFPQLEILECLGRGGMGVVYKARQPRLNRLVALKILAREKQQDAQFTERFVREAQALARLNHPNIVTVHDFGEVGGHCYLVMEFVDGPNLRQLLQARKMPSEQALAIVPKICEALQYAHEQGIVHRDIKPENILLDKQGRVKIADFGIAKMLGDETGQQTLTGAKDAVGTPHYMAPEQIEKPLTVDHRADIYSLGVVFYEMLTGELPLGKFQPPSQKVQIDVRLDEVVMHALEKEPERRYQQVSEVKTQLETIASTSAPTTVPAVSAEEILARDYTLNIRNCLRRGWALVRSDFWPLVGMSAFVLAVLSAAPSSGMALSNGHSSGTFSILGILLSGPLMGGLYLYFLKKIRREATGVETAFTGFRQPFPHLVIAGFLASLLTGLGFLCLILPGIYLFVAWLFTFPLIVDRRLDFWPAMRLSRKIISKHWWKFLGFLIVLGLINLAGVLVCGVGLFITFPITFAALVYAYEDIFGPAAGAVGKEPSGTPAAPPRPSGGWGTAFGVAAGVAVVLVFMAFLGLLAAIAIPNFIRARQHAIALHEQQVATKADYIGQTNFPYGDSIEITSVERTKNQMTVKGHYNLVSRDNALLALYITASTNKIVPEDASQRMEISKGQGDFELTHPYLTAALPGLPHVSMYADGKSFAALYFGTKAEAVEESKTSWITNVSSVSTLQFRLVLPEDSTEPADWLSSASGHDRFRLSHQVLLDDAAIAQAGVDFSPDGRRKIEIRFTDAGAQRFEEITATNIGHQLAIVFRGQLLSTPVIQSVIPNGECQVDGSMNASVVNEIADCLNRTTPPTAEAWNYSSIRERILPLKSLPNPLFGWLDLDSGMVMTNSSLDWQAHAGHEWIQANGLDVVTTESSKDLPTLLGIDTTIASAPTNGWDIVTPADVVHNWALLQEEPQQKKVFGAIPGQTDTFFFQTREGGKGILQILGFADNPRGVKIRYKLVENGQAADFTSLLNDDQQAVLAWTDRQFRGFFDTRSFDGWSVEERATLERKLIDSLKGPQSQEYYQAINTLAALHSTLALPALREIAFDRAEKDNRERWMATRALGIIGDKESVPEMIHLLYHFNSNTRWWAQISLVRLTGTNFAKDWNAWGKWWNEQNGQPPFKPEIIRWWSEQPEPDTLAESLNESDNQWLHSIKEERDQVQTGEPYLQQQLKLAQAGNYWAKFNLWEAFSQGKHGVARNPAEADQWLSELVKGAYLAKFEPVNGFNPKTPSEMLDQFSKYCQLYSGRDSLGGASFFRTTKQGDKLIGSFLTASPDEFKAAIEKNPNLKLISMDKVTPEIFLSHEAARQESL